MAFTSSLSIQAVGDSAVALLEKKSYAVADCIAQFGKLETPPGLWVESNNFDLVEFMCHTLGCSLTISTIK